jgi:hypothetical protein
VVEPLISRADTHVRHETALDGVGQVPQWLHGLDPYSMTNIGLDIVSE